MTRRGLMLGRFQPFHKGHLALTKQILSECDGFDTIERAVQLYRQGSFQCRREGANDS